jgi:hypothetical protein
MGGAGGLLAPASDPVLVFVSVLEILEVPASARLRAETSRAVVSTGGGTIVAAWISTVSNMESAGSMGTGGPLGGSRERGVVVAVAANCC